MLKRRLFLVICLGILVGSVVSACSENQAQVPTPTAFPTTTITVPTPTAIPTPTISLSIPIQPTQVLPTPILPSPTVPVAPEFDLNDYHFPSGISLTIQDGVVLWVVEVQGQTYSIPSLLSQSSFARMCDLKPDRSIALCKANRDDEQLSRLLASIADPATHEAVEEALFEMYAVRNPYFILTRDPPELVALTHEMDPRTGCWWYTEIQIACSTSHGTELWTVGLFDTAQRQYVTLPDEWNIDWHNSFREGYIHIILTIESEESERLINVYTIYGLDNTLIMQLKVLELMTTRDTVYFVTKCQETETCVQSIRIASNTIVQSQLWQLGVSWEDIRRCNVKLQPEDTTLMVRWCDQQATFSWD